MKSSRLSPEENFPEDLTILSDEEVSVINSKLHRQSDHEYGQGYSEPETEFRLEEVRLNIDSREDHERPRLKVAWLFP